MKKIYWRPQSTPIFAFVLLALFSTAGIFAVEHFRVEEKMPQYQKKIQAARLAMEAMTLVKDERLRRGIAIDPEADPLASGLIGSFVTSVTTDPGDLEAKQTSINPNFAAVVIDLLKQAEVKEGDPVAVSFTGSFPALNIAVYAALKTLNLKPTIISSVGGSQWGANNPNFLWIDMEQVLQQAGLFPFRSVAASLGGKHDQGREMTEKGRQKIMEAIKRNGLQFIKTETIREDIDRRMGIYFGGGAPKVFINVGGGRIAAGIRPYKVLLKSGLLSSQISTEIKGNSLIQRFMKERIPVIHLWNIKELAGHYGLPVVPATMPVVGEGMIYTRTHYNRWLAAGILLAIIGGLYIFSRSDWGFRIWQASSRREETGPPEPMV